MVLYVLCAKSEIWSIQTYSEQSIYIFCEILTRESNYDLVLDIYFETCLIQALNKPEFRLTELLMKTQCRNILLI